MKRSRPLNENSGCLSLFTRNPRSDNSVSSTSDDSITYYPAEEEDSFPYTINSHFLTDAELSFYQQASEVLSDKYVLCPQVSLAAILNINEPEFRENQIAFNKINRKRIDFVVCEVETMRMLYAIELDDASHKRPNRQKRDDFVNKAFEAAGLVLLRIEYQPDYNQQELIETLFRPLRPQKSSIPGTNFGENRNGCSAPAAGQPYSMFSLRGNYEKKGRDHRSTHRGVLLGMYPVSQMSKLFPCRRARKVDCPQV